MNLNATILGQAISFLIFVWFCMKYIWPPIILAIETRQKEIKESLTNLKNAQDQLFIVQKEIDSKIRESKEKVLIILNEANHQKSLILEQARKDALEESKKIFLNTQSEIQIEIREAHKNLHKEIVDLSIAVAEKIIEKNICKNDNQDLIDKLIVSLSRTQVKI